VARVAARRPTPSELVGAQAAIEAHALSADGRWLVYARRTVVRNRYQRHLWQVG